MKGREVYETAYRSGWRPEPRLSVTAWTDEHRVLGNRAGHAATHWRTETTRPVPVLVGRAADFWVNSVLGETWEERGDSVEPESLLARAERYSAEVPNGVGVLVAAVDVQGDRLECAVKGYGAGEESWLIAFSQFHGDPGREPVWLPRFFTHLRMAFSTVSCALGFQSEALSR